MTHYIFEFVLWLLVIIGIGSLFFIIKWLMRLITVYYTGVKLLLDGEWHKTENDLLRNELTEKEENMNKMVLSFIVIFLLEIPCIYLLLHHWNIVN